MCFGFLCILLLYNQNLISSMVFLHKKPFFVKILRFDKIPDVLPLRSLYIITIISFVKYLIRMRQISTAFFGNSAKKNP